VRWSLNRLWNPKTQKGLLALLGQAKIGGVFLPGGGTQSDATLKASLPLSENCFADVAFQYERYWIPSLGGPKRNLSGSLQLRWEPKLSLLH